MMLPLSQAILNVLNEFHGGFISQFRGLDKLIQGFVHAILLQTQPAQPIPEQSVFGCDFHAVLTKHGGNFRVLSQDIKKVSHSGQGLGIVRILPDGLFIGPDALSVRSAAA